MKDAYEVFDEKLKLIIKIMDTTNQINCFRLSVDLESYSEIVGFEKGVFIAEMLENVFHDIGSLFDDFEFEEEKKLQIIKELKNFTEKILMYYKEDDPNLFITLQKMRFFVTQIDKQSWHLLKKKGEE